MKKKVATLTTLAVLSSPFIVEASTESYNIKKGDSLYSIAKKYGTTILDLKKLNSLTSDLIFPNQKLIVSQSNLSNQKTDKPNTSSTAPSITVTPKKYTVVSGDTLIKIANQNGVSLGELRIWNNIEGHIIYPGQVFIVSKPTGSSSNEVPTSNTNTSSQASPNSPAVSTPPAHTTNVTEYRIKSGDTLGRIAIQFGLSVQELKTINKLTSDLIFAGQTLSVVKTDNVDNKTNVTKTNFSSTLVSNAQKFLGTPYLWGGTTPSGFDCSGFIYYVFNESNKKIGRLTAEGYYNRSYYVDKPDIGDLVFFENTYKKGISHLGIYIGDNKFIHSENRGVIITDLNNSYYKQRFDGFKRFY